MRRSNHIDDLIVELELALGLSGHPSLRELDTSAAKQPLDGGDKRRAEPD